MSKRTRIVALAFAAAASVGSAGPCYYSAALQPVLTLEDLVFDSTLLGSWIGTDDEDSTRFVFERPGTSRWYELTITSARDTADFQVGLGRFGDTWIADAYPSGDWSAPGYGFHVVPVHHIVRLWLYHDSLWYASLSGEWLNRMIELHHLDVPHQRLELEHPELSSVLYLLTGSARQLQDFLRRHASDSSAFSDTVELHRAPGGRSP